MRRVFVAGTWRKVSPEHAAAGQRVGELIAQAGFDLGCGPGTGISEHVIAGFRSVRDRVGRVHFVLPAKEHSDGVGEVVRYELADRIEQTDLDYPMRNLHQVKHSDGVVVVTGGDGTLEEILPALVDYGLPVGVLAGSGPAARGLELLLPLFPDWAPLVRMSPDAEQITRWVLERLGAT